MTIAQQLEQKGYKEGYKEGYEEGFKEGKMKVARKLLAVDTSLESVRELTDLSYDDLANL